MTHDSILHFSDIDLLSQTFPNTGYGFVYNLKPELQEKIKQRKARRWQRSWHQNGVFRMNWVFLGIAILAEVVATSALKAAEGFTRTIPSAVVIVGYLVAFYFLSLTLRTIPMGVAYAIWSGVGISLIALVGWLLYGQTLDLPVIFGVALIVTGVIILNGFFKSVAR